MQDALTTRSLWHDNAERSSIRTAQYPLDEDRVVVEAHYSLVSTGTELLVARGHVPPQLQIDMGVPYMQGDLMLPVKYGYSLAGIDTSNGRPVHVMHPHQDRCPVDRASLFEIPDGVPLKRAALASNTETALNAVWDASIAPGERALVVGFGIVGSLVARIVSGIPGIELMVAEINPARAQLAREMGFGVVDIPITTSAPFDLAFNSSASEEGLQTALDAVGLEGRVIELSWYGDKQVSISLGGEFHALRKRILSSQVSRIPSHMATRWNFRRRKEAVFRLLRDPSFDMHITHEITLDEAPKLFEQWRKQSPDGIGYVIRYSN